MCADKGSGFWQGRPQNGLSDFLSGRWCVCKGIYPRANTACMYGARLPGRGAHRVPTPPIDPPPSVLACSGWHHRVHTLGGLNSRRSLLEVLEASSPGSRCQLIRLLPEEGSLPELQVADFSVGLPTASPQCVNMEREREGAGRKGGEGEERGKGRERGPLL